MHPGSACRQKDRIKKFKGIVPFNHQLVKETTRKNIFRIVFQRSDRKSAPVQRTLKRETLQGLSPTTMAPRLRWRCIIRDQGIPIPQMTRLCPRPQKGAGMAQGGRSKKQEISRWNMAISKFNYVHFFCF